MGDSAESASSVVNAVANFEESTEAPSVVDFESVDSTEHLAEDKFVGIVERFVEDNPVLERFFKDKKYFVKELARKTIALQQTGQSTAESEEHILHKTIKVSLYQQVIYCDDSSSMRREHRWDTQKSIVERITRITTRVLPIDEGVLLRFINQDAPKPLKLPLRYVESIFDNCLPAGSTQIGTNLRSKVLQPLIYDKLDSIPKSLERPLLISILTDGEPDHESPDTLENAIMECSRRLDAAKYPRESVKFMIGQIGTSRRTYEFLEDLRHNREISDLLFCIPGM
ncbi:hypothetical protein K505DRAFT_239289 [Melanomma pulvis-pyrius CBS 109.77]|uniref:VWFA domain-containing protein n=1 Tax=Melanomma pulvis-pyrius CBS 109.77 TaxID=1314802 RepID=A0A6A6XII2_9PLEO|nr:hypothetical protein K505DRAFT_239289 [Melanomma pulvis-pyrius CBS 109.77]